MCPLLQSKIQKPVFKGRLDLVIELKVKEESALVSEVAALDGMLSASMISHDGEVTF